MGRRVLIALSVAALLNGSSARADQAEDLYEAGITAYREGRYQEAISKLQASFDTKPVSKVLIDIGQAHLRLGNGRDALFFFNYYLRDAIRIPPTVRADVERYIAEAKTLTPATAAAPRRPPAPPSLPPPSEMAAAPNRGALPARAAPMPVAEEEISVGTTVNFLAKDRETRYRVVVNGQRCVTPCRLDLEPGTTQVSVLWPRQFRRDIVLPHIAAAVRLSHWKTGNVVGGSILTPLGLIATIVGSVFLVPQCTTTVDFWGTATCHRTDAGLGLGIPITLAGIGMMTGGIVLLATIGRNKAEVLPLRAEE